MLPLFLRLSVFQCRWQLFLSGKLHFSLVKGLVFLFVCFSQQQERVLHSSTVRIELLMLFSIFYMFFYLILGYFLDSKNVELFFSFSSTEFLCQKFQFIRPVHLYVSDA